LGTAFDIAAGVLRVIASAGFVSAAEVEKIAPAIAVMTKSLRICFLLEVWNSNPRSNFERFHCKYMDCERSIINVPWSRRLATARCGNAQTAYTFDSATHPRSLVDSNSIGFDRTSAGSPRL
jgi:hypothetical protein